MANYWVTFRIASDAGYDKRYGEFLQAMIKARSSSWAEPTSFWLVSSTLGIDAFVAALSIPLDATKDLLVVRELAVDSSRYFGKVEHLAVLKEFLPNIKKAA